MADLCVSIEKIKTRLIHLFFFCSPLFHSHFPELRLPTILCKYFTLSTCRVAERIISMRQPISSWFLRSLLHVCLVRNGSCLMGSWLMTIWRSRILHKLYPVLRPGHTVQRRGQHCAPTWKLHHVSTLEIVARNVACNYCGSRIGSYLCNITHNTVCPSSATLRATSWQCCAQWCIVCPRLYTIICCCLFVVRMKFYVSWIGLCLLQSLPRKASEGRRFRFPDFELARKGSISFALALLDGKNVVLILVKTLLVGAIEVNKSQATTISKSILRFFYIRLSVAVAVVVVIIIIG